MPGESFVVQVFNGSGEPYVASLVADSLRRRGVDVRSVVKLAGRVYPYTLLLDRRGDELKADSLLAILGLPRERLVLQRNNDIYDATVVIGRDYRAALAKILGGS